jgi:hypothetical protein
MMSKNITFFVDLDQGRNHDITCGETKSVYRVTVPQLNLSYATGRFSASKIVKETHSYYDFRYAS